nr:DUF1127 domain-containing protein [Tranquillimonas alkanivorans]
MPDGRVVRAILRTFAGIAAWNDARISRKALNALSDRELDDVGLHRGAIERFVRR